jgi:3-methyladenine DNA glycosylase/8-oxoguanine DNA glycosylase
MYHRAKIHFKKADPILYRAAKLHKIANIHRSRDVFGDLVHAIVNQQLSGKAADTIYGRLEDLILEKIARKREQGAERRIDHKSKEWGKSNSGTITPKFITALKISTLRKCGLSVAKAETIKGLARTVVRKEIDLVNIHKHPDDKVMELLTSIKGIGPWTAEMILMFSLGRTDIFSKGDLGLRKGIMHLYGLKKMPSDRFMNQLTKAWSPYRTYAARVIWRVADGEK